MVAKPCPFEPAHCTCHICWLFQHDPRYRKLWGGTGEATPASPTVARSNYVRDRVQRGKSPCVHLGGKLELKTSCPVGCGGGTEKHFCAKHGECRRFGQDPSIRVCSSCDDYTSQENLTVSQWVDILISPNPINIAGVYCENQTAAVQQIVSQVIEQATPPSFSHELGVVTSGGGKYWPGTWVQASILRELGWDHPIQAWYLGQAEHDGEWISRLESLGVQCIDAYQVRKERPYRILNGFEVKLYAVANSGFSQPIWLDSDCYPCRNPEVLFQCGVFCQTGSIHWPDLANAEPWTKWSRWGVKPDGSPPIETGQYIYDMTKVWTETAVALKLNEMSDVVYHWDYGDKGPARVAWAWTQKSRAIYERVPAWVGPAFLHIAQDGEPVFIHRCRGKVNPDGAGFYTPQHQDGTHAHNLPGESMYQHFLKLAKPEKI